MHAPPGGLSWPSAGMYPITFHLYFSKIPSCMHGLMCDDECHSLLPSSFHNNVLMHPFAFGQQMIPVSMPSLLWHKIMIWI